MQRLIVTIDGPAGAGKSTVARRLAKRLKVEFLDTGAMYRALTVHCLDQGVDPATEPHAAVMLAHQCRMAFDWQSDPPRILVNSSDLTMRIRDPAIQQKVSQLAAIQEIRKIMVALQRKISQDHPRLVTEGRDQGSVVFPDATAKFFLTASLVVRSKRRADELRRAGHEFTEEQLRRSIDDRDRNDQAHNDGRSQPPSSAVHVDTSDMTLDQVVDHLAEQVEREGRT